MTRFRWRYLTMVVGAVLSASLGSAAQPLDGAAPMPDLLPDGGRLRLAAEEGDFQNLLSLLRSDHSAAGSPRASSLIGELERYTSHEAAWSARRQTAFTFAHDEGQALASDGQVEDALAFAIEAHGLADNKAAFLEDPAVAALIDQAALRAADAVAQAQWIEAMDLYRRLDLLFDDPDSPYHKAFLDTAGHLRVLRIYVPDLLKAMYEQHARERNEDLDPIQFGQDTWRERLAGVTRPMLMQSLNEAEHRHVNSEGYKPLLLGAVEAALTLLETPGLEQAFPELANPESVDTLRQALIAQRDRLNRMDGDLTRFEAAELFERIFRANAKSVRLPENVLVYEMTEGALGTLDEFTAVIWPYDYDQFARNTRGSFPGVGIQISMSNAPLTVTDLSPDGPAVAAGLRDGDAITRINGQAVTAYSPRYVMWKLRHPRQDGLSLGVERRGEKQMLELTVTQPLDVKVKRPPGQLTVKSPLRGTPAYEAGVQAEDVVVAVDGESTEKWTLDQAVRRITGPEGSTVTLTLERKGEPEPLGIPIRRAEIDIESIKGWTLRNDGSWDYYVDREHHIGYVRLLQFIPQSSDDLDAAINQMEAEGGVEGLVLDLRFNPGGLLNQAVDVTDRFVRTGTIVSTVSAGGQVSDERRARPERTYKPFPVVVLINQGSASASEIVAGALQDHGRAIILGERSFGKGSVQDLFRIGDDHAYLKLTTQYYRLPNNRIIHRTPKARDWGIDPDLLVDMTDDQVRDSLELRQQLDVIRAQNGGVPAATVADASRILLEGLDPQLETAVLLLKTHQVAHDLEAARKPEPVVTR